MPTITMTCHAQVTITFDDVADEIEEVTITQPGLNKYTLTSGRKPTPGQLLTITEWTWEEFKFASDESDHLLFQVTGRDAADLTTHQRLLNSSDPATAAAQAAVLHRQDTGNALIETKALLYKA